MLLIMAGLNFIIFILNKMAKKLLICEENKKEIFYNLINAGLAGLLVFLGSFTNGGFSWSGVGFAFLAALIVCITKFKEYWDGEAPEYSKKILSFIS